MAMTINQVHETKIGWKIFSYIVMVFFAVFTLAPLIWLFYTSFKPHRDIIKNVFAFPTSFFVGNYVSVWTRAQMGILLLNSIFYSVGATVITVFFALAAGFGFAKFGYKISKVFYSFFIMGLLIVLNAVIIPLFIMERTLRIDDTYIGVFLPYIAFGLPFNVYLATSFIKSIPDSMVEAAFMDGCSYLKIFVYIIIQLATPVVATMIIFGFINNWNELILMLTLTSRSAIRSLPVGIFAFAGTGMSRDYGKQMAASVIGIVPILIFYIAFHKQLEKGFAAGALKE